MYIEDDFDGDGKKDWHDIYIDKKDVEDYYNKMYSPLENSSASDDPFATLGCVLVVIFWIVLFIFAIS